MADLTSSSPLVVLLTADCINDIVPINRVLSAQIGNFRVQWLADGRELIQYLLRYNRFADRSLYPTPGLVVLCDEMPRVDGYRALTLAREHKLLGKIPFVFLSSSRRSSDRELALQLGARLFVPQPVDKLRFAEQLAGLEGLKERAA